MAMKEKIILTLILLLAGFLRLYHLDKVPPGFHIDEVIVGYNAYSLMETGRDENGNLSPLYIDSFGDFPPAGYFYLTIPSIRIFGLNEFAVRFPHAVFGILTVLLLFLLAEKIFHNRFISFLSVFLLAISPWHIMMTRATSEVSSGLFVIMSGAYLFLIGSERSKIRYLILSLILFFLSFHIYPAARVIVPILAIVLALLNWPKLKTTRYRVAVFSFLAICILSALLVILVGPGRGRFNQVGILSQAGVQLRLNEQIREERPGTNALLLRLFHNKLINYSLETLSNYGKHFSFDFLFIKGGLPIRYVVPEAGLLYLVELPFLLFGIYYIFRNKNKLFLLPVFWLLIGPIATSLTFEDVPNVRRSFFMLPAFQLITAYGFYVVLEITRKRKFLKNLLISFSALVLLFNFLYFTHQYFVHQRVYRPWYRNYGFKELVLAMNNLSPNYQKIVLTKDPNDPYIYILFYNKYDPRIYHQYAPLRSKNEWGFEKYVFSPAKCPSQLKEEALKEEKILFVDKGECETEPYAHVLKTIYREDNTPAFQLVGVDKNLATEFFKKQEQLKSQN